MRTRKMHADQLATDAALARRLVEGQFPEWASLPIEPVVSDGTSNAMYRLGESLAVRLPLVANDAKTEQLDKEHRWLPVFDPVVPLALPVPVARGEPTDEYASPWTVCRWIEGRTADFECLADPVAAARDLAAFVNALQRVNASEAPAPGAHNFMRGLPLADFDAQMRECIPKIAACGEPVDVAALAAAWEADLHAPLWPGPPVWLHGDLSPGNILARDGRLAGVIDWGGAGAGDPAIELLPAWNLFEDESARAYRDALGVNDATWRRGRGLALRMGVIALPYYYETNPAIVRWARRLIDVVLRDHALEG